MSTVARVRVTMQLVIDALHLPPGTEITQCRMSPERFGDVEFTVCHHDLPDVAQGQQIPQAIVEIRRFESRYKLVER